MSLHVIAITVIQYMQCMYIYIYARIYKYCIYIYIHISTYTHLCYTLLYVHYIIYIYQSSTAPVNSKSFPAPACTSFSLAARSPCPASCRPAWFSDHWTGEMIQLLICLIRDIHGEYPSNNFTKHWDMDWSRWGFDKKGD